ncbi:hypothetical protein [Flavobacterium orientale]|uniref:hypothetical protein n=1 Tax=Flavobacterium orientale TaxID=1756020 RepID=UPI001E55245C|nr:hypothetical protein [Flavobacterium orientale]
MELAEFSKNGENILLVLDSCVCIDIVNIFSEKENSKVDKTRIYNLIEYAQKHNINQFSLYSLVESCYDRKTKNILPGKFFDFKNKIDFAFQVPIAKLKKNNYNFESLNFKAPEIKNQLLNLLMDERVNIFYAGLLKICEIAQRGLKTDCAEKNILEFIEWMENELDVILGYEYMLALQIFGGNTKFRSMLKIGSSAKEKILKAAWATAWDLFHAKVSCHRDQLTQIVNQKVYPIFVTKDSNLFELISPQVDSYFRYEHTRLSLIDGNIPQCYSKSFMDILNKKFIELNLKRIHKNTNRTIESERIKLIIKRLEDSLN